MMPVIVVGAGISGLCTAALLARDGIAVNLYEQSPRVGGRTSSMEFRGHILDNGFHIMPFYKTSAVYGVLKMLGIDSELDLVKVDRIAFYSNGFYKYPLGILDILRMSLVPLRSRIKLLEILVPMAFSTMKHAEASDSIPLSSITGSMDVHTRSFFDAVCMLAFADVPECVSLGEFTRTMIRANPFRGGTSEFAYPASGGYDRIAQLLASYIVRCGGRISLGTAVHRIVVSDGCARGVLLADGRQVDGAGVVVSCPAYDAMRHLFEPGTFDKGFTEWVDRLNKTTSVVEVHYCLSKRVDDRQIVFPVGEYAAKGVFFISNITPAVSPAGEHLMMAGTPVSTDAASDPARIRSTAEGLKSDMCKMYPDFADSLLWERPMAWRLVESVAKAPGMVWKDKMPHQVSIRGLYFVGDSTVSYGIGTDSAAHSSVLCHPKITRYLGTRRR